MSQPAHAARFFTATGLFVLLLFTGTAWVTLVEVIPAGLPRDLVTCGVGLAFAAVFLWLLVTRVQAVYAGEGFRRRDVAMMAVNLLLMLLAYAYVYGVLGITDTTREGNPVVGGVNEGFSLLTLARCFYFSVATLTTVGYGDFRPTAGVCRVVAGSQALLGYLVLGVLASTAANLIQSVAGRGGGRG
ncbi:ion channel [Phycisphaera mikurensis]|uniref:Potassium channel domain-containing protein n=1 Tax=Phycisphaera mikurensis (strain NBRC 102666 / KCTC 22515 / FYK2301M01) TaxID=1142394 RepID=I0IEH0_PHYMF|nr:ion channel [Phycisphaera mikurensis]MBB6441457.1 hypothetical protein [Phycisphaera mikurensis]BAM03658.1 hypothetical protein PSMK_14990 [Phycisphaera mikurensis NBRC 102666]